MKDQIRFKFHKESILIRVALPIHLIVFHLCVAAICFSCSSGGIENGKRIAMEIDHYQLAEQYYGKKRYTKSKSELNKVLEDNPGHVDAHYKLGVIYGKEGEIKDGIREFEKVISIDPDYDKAYYNLGVLHASLGNAESIKIAKGYFDRFLELKPDTELRSQIESWKMRHPSTEISRQPKAFQ